jgi:hypothetical protein
VVQIRRVKCWDAPSTQRFQLLVLMKAAGGESVRFAFASEREVDQWAVAISLITDLDPSPWEHNGSDPDAEFVEEVLEVKVK